MVSSRSTTVAVTKLKWVNLAEAVAQQYKFASAFATATTSKLLRLLIL
jgi:hypothetical protein